MSWHHSDPKFMGGKKNQKLTMPDEVDHRQLHKEINDFLVEKTKLSMVVLFTCDNNAVPQSLQDAGFRNFALIIY